MKVLYCGIGFCKERNEQRMKTFYLNNTQKTERRIQMIIKMVNEFILTVIYFARINPMQNCACA